MDIYYHYEILTKLRSITTPLRTAIHNFKTIHHYLSTLAYPIPASRAIVETGSIDVWRGSPAVQQNPRHGM